MPQINEPFSHLRSRGPYPDPVTSLFLLKRAKCPGSGSSPGTAISAVLPLWQLRSPAELVPRYGKEADCHLTRTNCHAYSKEFWLDKYLDKEMFYALTLSS